MGSSLIVEEVSVPVGIGIARTAVETGWLTCANFVDNLFDVAGETIAGAQKVDVFPGGP
jgi:hypothetical protein